MAVTDILTQDFSFSRWSIGHSTMLSQRSTASYQMGASVMILYYLLARRKWQNAQFKVEKTDKYWKQRSTVWVRIILIICLLIKLHHYDFLILRNFFKIIMQSHSKIMYNSHSFVMKLYILN
jgi:hypothetical protein